MLGILTRIAIDSHSNESLSYSKKKKKISLKLNKNDSRTSLDFEASERILWQTALFQSRKLENMKKL